MQVSLIILIMERILGVKPALEYLRQKPQQVKIMGVTMQLWGNNESTGFD
jgi:hypothetical protein